MAAKKLDCDEAAKLLAGQLGVSAVLANMLVDKGAISREELCDHFRQAYGATMVSIGGLQSAPTFWRRYFRILKRTSENGALFDRPK